MSRLVRLALILGVVSGVYSCGKPDSSESPVFFRIPTHHLSDPEFPRDHFNRDHLRDDTYAFGYMDQERFSSLPRPIAADTTVLDAKVWRHRRFDPKTLRILEESEVGTEDHEPYHDYEALTEELMELADRFPELARLESAGQTPEGRELWYLRLSDHIDEDEREPQLLYIANMHGDEVVGKELMIYLARLLLTDYESDPRIAQLLDHSQIYIMPTMNPDGNERGWRNNANRRDLNRNFPDFTSSPSDTPNGRQPETAAIMKMHEETHFQMALNFHGGYVCFNMPWDTQPNRSISQKFGDDPLMVALGREYANANETMRDVNGSSFDNGLTYGYEWYEVNGGLQDWANHYRRSIHATIELSFTKWPNASSLPQLWEENRESLIRYLERGQVGLHLHVVDESGEGISGVTVDVSTSRRALTFETPWIHRPTLPGRQTVTVTAEGYQTLEFEADSQTFAGEFQTVEMASLP